MRERAEALLRQAIAIARELGHFEYLSIQSHSLGLLLDEMDRPAEAEDAMAQCLKYGARIGDYRHMSRASMFLASAKLGRGDGKAALAELKNTLRFDMRDTVRRGTLETSMAPRIAANALSCAAAGGDVCTAVLVAESAKALPLAISLMRGVPLQAAAAAGDASRGSAVEGLFRRREELRLKAMWEPDSAAEIESQLEQVDAELTGARQEAALRDVRYARWHDATYLEVTEPATARRILGETGARATLAGFLVHGSSIYTYALWSDGEMAERLPLPRELASIKEDAGMALDPAVMAALAQVFLEPLAGRLEKLEPRDRLILSPSAPLDRLPFGMLRFRNRYLCEVATLSAVDGIGMLEGCAARPAAPVREAVCIGAPPRPDVPDLSYAARELERVTEVLEKAGVKARPALNGRAATIGALAARIGSCDVAHFACHALAPGAGHAEAQLLLAPDLLSKDSGVLSEDRILFHLALKPGCHINLAGCRTGAAGGAGRFFPHGLVPAFLVAGARSVLASLWPLEDEPASRFQSLYYEELISGRTPADALAATQRACIQGNAGEPLRQPGGWAPYLLHGLG